MGGVGQEYMEKGGDEERRKRGQGVRSPTAPFIASQAYLTVAR